MFHRYHKTYISFILIIAMLLGGCGNAASARRDRVEKAVAGEINELFKADSGDTADEVSSDNESSDISDNAASDNKEAAGETTLDGKASEKLAGSNVKLYTGDGYEVSFKLESEWDTGFNANVVIKNTGSMRLHNWSLKFTYKGKLSNIWNAVIVSSSDNKYELKNADYNKDIEPGTSVDFGMSENTKFKGFPTELSLEASLEKTDATPAPTTDPGDINEGSADQGSSDQGTADQTGESSVSDEQASSDEDSSVGEAVEDTISVSNNIVKKHGRLKVKGRYIVDNNNRKFLIKGPSTHGIAWFPQYVNKSCFKSFKKWGANTIRLACYSSTGEGYNTGSVWNTIDKGVKAATALGMYVVIDWHILNENNPMTTLKAAKKFFKHFASKYGKRKNVIWEICNEPHWCEWKKDIKPYAKKIIKLIRKYSSNIIVVGTPTWSQDVDVVAASPLTGTYKKNVCYTLHFYAATHKDDLRNRVKTAISKGLPILCTEFSICEASGDGYLDKASGNAWIKLMKKNNIGFLAWNISNKAETSSFIKPGCTKSGTLNKKNLTAAGKWVIKKWK